MTARRLHAGQNGAKHWWSQRLSAVALVPLTIWFVFFLAQLPVHDFQTVSAWLSNLWNATAMVLILIVGFYHAALGVDVIIDDYIHHYPLKMALTIIQRLFCLSVAVIGILAVLRVALDN